MSDLIATLLGLYLLFAHLPTLVAWRRGLPADNQVKTLVYGVLLGWTVIGWIIAWWHALDDAPNITLHLVSNANASAANGSCRAKVTIAIQEDEKHQARSDGA